MSAGKGDTPRPVNSLIYRANYEAIFGLTSVNKAPKVTLVNPPYPDCICAPCGRAYGRNPEGNSFGATYHLGKCDVCGEATEVTEPRDWGHLDWPLKKKACSVQECPALSNNTGGHTAAPNNPR
jgi:hypothetical protein